MEYEPLLQEDNENLNEDWKPKNHPFLNENVTISKYDRTIVNNAANRRKRILAFISISVIIFVYLNVFILNNKSDDQIPVPNQPSENDIQDFISKTTTEKQKSTNLRSTYRPELPTHKGKTSTSRKPADLLTTPTTNDDSTTISTEEETTPTSENPFYEITTTNLSEITTSPNSVIVSPPPGYVVFSDKCKIPEIDPHTPEVMHYFKAQKYEPCSKDKPLTNIKFNSTSKKYTLFINPEQILKYTKPKGKLDCCYQVIERNAKGKNADKKVDLSKCVTFGKSVELPSIAEFVLVKCKSNKKQTYINAHATMPEKPEIRKRLKEWEHKAPQQKPISVMMVGIDSVSRVNLFRAMPKTAKHLQDNDWFELSGYNKIGDNTFPNLMAILTGFNESTAYNICAPTKIGALDKCPIIWKRFKELGYVTAYAEDAATINTFNYHKLGFEKPPVDYYMRPFLLSAQSNLKIKTKSGLQFCLGYQHSADYIYDYALELATRYPDEPYFGFFWTNTFSHNAISDCSSMDDRMVYYLKEFQKRKVLDKSIVVFFSDHGMRFGETRKFYSGYMEGRLPFIYIWIPSSVKKNYPEIVEGLRANKNRLTNPYDLHLTLKNILEMSGRVNNLPRAENCPKCQTLFQAVPLNRSCDEAAIDEHWCTCVRYKSISKDLNIVKKVAAFTVHYINDLVHKFAKGSIAKKCASLELGDIHSAYQNSFRLDKPPHDEIDMYRVVFETKPNSALFEATVRYTVKSKSMTIPGTSTISRLNMYAEDSKCITEAGAKKYCSCIRSLKDHQLTTSLPSDSQEDAQS